MSKQAPARKQHAGAPQERKRPAAGKRSSSGQESRGSRAAGEKRRRAPAPAPRRLRIKLWLGLTATFVFTALGAAWSYVIRWKTITLPPAQLGPGVMLSCPRGWEYQPPSRPPTAGTLDAVILHPQPNAIDAWIAHKVQKTEPANWPYERIHVKASERPTYVSPEMVQRAIYTGVARRGGRDSVDQYEHAIGPAVEVMTPTDKRMPMTKTRTLFFPADKIGGKQWLIDLECEGAGAEQPRLQAIFARVAQSIRLARSRSGTKLLTPSSVK